MKSITMIGFPMDLGADRRGVDMGPSALRIADIEGKLRELGYEVQDIGNVDVKTKEVQTVVDPRLKYLPEISISCESLGRAVKDTLDNGSFPLILGGDHSMSIGSIAGIASHCKEKGKRLGVVWIDAHADMNIPDTTPSGNIHGMPLSVSMGLGVEQLTMIMGFAPKVAPENVAVVGIRSVDPGEKQLIRDLGVHAYPMPEIDRRGMYAVMNDIIEYMSRSVDHVHVSFDLDSVDPTLAEGVGTPVPGGLTFREIHLAMEMIAEAGIMNSLEVAEVNPILDNKNNSARFAADVVASTMGKRIL
ncbi:MAG: arginase [Candidatus Kapabacteria bacterium]|nr:arginase [Candidatus Kapabacteria bacterium]